jgi:hypothetical protein
MKSAIAVITLRARSDFGSGYRPAWISIKPLFPRVRFL